MDSPPLKTSIIIRLLPAAFLACILFNFNTARAESWFYFDPVKIEAIIAFDGSDRRNTSDDVVRNTLLQTSLKLGQDGYILHPGIAMFSLTLEPAYAWNNIEFKSASSDAPEIEDFNTSVLSYSFAASLMRDMPQPFNINLAASRGSSVNKGTFGSRFKTNYESLSATIAWEFSPFPMNFSYEQDSFNQDEQSSFNNSFIERDESLETWTIEGQSSKTKLLVERRILNDRVEDRQQDYTQDRARLQHRLSWGRGSNLRSYLEYFSRSGFNRHSTLQIRETAHIQHTDTVSSRSSYRFHTVTQNLKNYAHSGDFNLQHRLYENLFTSAGVGGTLRQSDELNETSWFTKLQSQYRKSNLFGAAVNTGIGLSYRETARDSSQQFIEVIDEAHVVPLNGMVLLNQRFVVGSTIIVTNADSTLVYIEGFDYRVVDLTEGFTQLQAMPGGQINTGDTILVSYKAQGLPTQDFSTTLANFNLGIRLGKVNFTHHSSRSKDKPLSAGSEIFLRDDRTDTTTIDINWNMAKVGAHVSAMRNFFQTPLFETTTFTFRQSLALALSPITQWNLNLIEQFGDTGSRKFEAYSLNLSASWQPWPRFSVSPWLGAWRQTEEDTSINTEIRKDTFVTYGVTMNWHYRQLSMDFRYRYNQRNTERLDKDPSQVTENILGIRLIRRFR